MNIKILMNVSFAGSHKTGCAHSHCPRSLHWVNHAYPWNTSEEMKEVALNLDALRRYNNPSQMTQLQELFLSRRNLERNLYWIHVWENVIIKTFSRYNQFLIIKSGSYYLCILELCVIFIHKQWLWPESNNKLAT